MADQPKKAKTKNIDGFTLDQNVKDALLHDPDYTKNLPKVRALENIIHQDPDFLNDGSETEELTDLLAHHQGYKGEEINNDNLMQTLANTDPKNLKTKEVEDEILEDLSHDNNETPEPTNDL